MDFSELSALWLLVPLAAAFGLGWVASRFDGSQWRKTSTDAPRAYFKGLNFLLNEQQDKAIDAFIEAVRLDPQTVELQFALGNLFRRRGEFERSVRIHESLMARSDLKPQERERAQFELANDFLKAGLLDRAELSYKAIAALPKSPHASAAWSALLTISERSKHWADAIAAAEALQAQQGAGSYARWIAQYHCELAEIAQAAGDHAAAQAALDAALKSHTGCVRALILRGDWLASDAKAALEAWLAVELAPSYLGLVAPRVALLVSSGKLEAADDAKARAALTRWFADQPCLDTADALYTLAKPEERQAVLHTLLEKKKSLSAAMRWLDAQGAKGTSEHQALQQALERGAQAGQRYRCASCGFEAKRYFWQCPGCSTWESYPPKRVDDL
jgi:lipopolysaccharide assembly protein B